MNPSMYLLTGPTAVGKTALCLRLAKELDAEILSCDSMQVYKGLDIATAKPTPAELAAVRHHGIDVFPVDSAANIQAYVQMAAEAVEDIASRGRNILVAGGSGFYLKSFLEPVCDEVQVPAAIRKEVATLHQAEGLEGLVERIHAHNPDGVGDLDLQNPRRVVRALERCMATGKTVLELRAELDSMPAPYPQFQKKTCVLARGDEILRDRIQQRTAKMLSDGLLDEVSALLGRGLLRNATAAASIGYREVIARLQGRSDPQSDLAAEINRSTWQLVRRQRKWFRSQLASARTLDLDACPEPSIAELFS